MTAAMIYHNWRVCGRWPVPASCVQRKKQVLRCAQHDKFEGEAQSRRRIGKLSALGVSAVKEALTRSAILCDYVWAACPAPPGPAPHKPAGRGEVWPAPADAGARWLRRRAPAGH